MIAGETIPLGPSDGGGTVANAFVFVAPVVVVEPFTAETEGTTTNPSPSAPIASARLRKYDFLSLRELLAARGRTVPLGDFEPLIECESLFMKERIRGGASVQT